MIFEIGEISKDNVTKYFPKYEKVLAFFGIARYTYSNVELGCFGGKE